MQNIKDLNLVTTFEASQKTGISQKTISNLCYCREITAEKSADGRKWLVNLDSLNQYKKDNIRLFANPKRINNRFVFGDMILREDETMKPVTTYQIDIFDSLRYEFTQPYYITNFGRVFNSDGNEMKLYGGTERDPYLYFNAKRIDDEKINHSEHIDVHRLVAYFFCRRGFKRYYVHHIDLDKLNNHYKNLILLTDAEHKKAHKLYNTDKKAYRKFINEIRRDNKKNGYLCIA